MEKTEPNELPEKPLLVEDAKGETTPSVPQTLPELPETKPTAKKKRRRNRSTSRKWPVIPAVPAKPPPLLSLSALSKVWREAKLVEDKESLSGEGEAEREMMAAGELVPLAPEESEMVSKTKAVEAIAVLHRSKGQSKDWVQKQIVATWDRQPVPTKGDGSGCWVVAQHFVPGFYLKKWLFSRDYYLRVRYRYVAMTDEPERMLKRAERVCVINDLYSQRFERWIANTVEKKNSYILNDLEAGTGVETASLEWLVALVATTYIRIPVLYNQFRDSRCGWLRDGVDFIAQDLEPLLCFLLEQKWVLAKVERALPTSDCPIVALSGGTTGIARVDLVKIAKGGGVVAGERGVFVLMPLTPYHVLMCQVGKPCKGLSEYTVVDAVVEASDCLLLGDVAPRTRNRLKPRLSAEEFYRTFQGPKQKFPPPQKKPKAANPSNTKTKQKKQKPKQKKKVKATSKGDKSWLWRW